MLNNWNVVLPWLLLLLWVIESHLTQSPPQKFKWCSKRKLRHLHRVQYCFDIFNFNEEEKDFVCIFLKSCQVLPPVWKSEYSGYFKNFYLRTVYSRLLSYSNSYQPIKLILTFWWIRSPIDVIPANWLIRPSIHWQQVRFGDLSWWCYSHDWDHGHHRECTVNQSWGRL